VPEFCPGYCNEPFKSLAEAAPGLDAYPKGRFRYEWGPVFHRGRLDASARVLVIGQDPAQHEAIARRALVGAAGHRLQGFLAKLGIDRSYVLVNTFLYSVYGTLNSANIKAAPIADYRNRWLDSLLPGKVEVVVALGDAADAAWQLWLSRKPTPLAAEYAKIHHPTWPESASAHQGSSAAALTKQMLTQWNDAIKQLRSSLIHPDAVRAFRPYGDAFGPDELVEVPAFDLPAGTPDWMRGANWAQRTGTNPTDKRYTITVTVPASSR